MNELEKLKGMIEQRSPVLIVGDGNGGIQLHQLSEQASVADVLASAHTLALEYGQTVLALFSGQLVGPDDSICQLVNAHEKIMDQKRRKRNLKNPKPPRSERISRNTHQQHSARRSP